MPRTLGKKLNAEKDRACRGERKLFRKPCSSIYMYDSFLSPSPSLHSFFRSFTFSHSILYLSLSHLNPLPSSLISVYSSLFLLPLPVSFPSLSTFSSFLVSFSASLSLSLSVLKFFNLFVFLPPSRAFCAN